MALSRRPTLGTQLRHLIEMLDGAVEQAYARAGLDYRPRYTPIVRALIHLGPSSLREISRYAGITHSAVSQTVAQMGRQGLVHVSVPSDGDARERIVALTQAAEAMLPALKRQWAATNAAAQALDTELSAPLSDLLQEAILALERQPFSERIEQATVKRESPDEKE